MNNIIVIKMLEDMVLSNKHLTIGEILYSVFRERNSKLPFNDFAFVLRYMSNNDFYTIIEKAHNQEKEDV